MSGGLALFLGLTGAAAGSFVALVAERMLRGEGWVRGGSRCLSCKAPLRARDLVPLVSWPLLRGRCAHCGAPIPSVLWQAEVTGAAMGIAAAFSAADPARALLLAVWMWSLLALALADLRRFRLPDGLLAVSAALGLALTLAGDGTGWPDMAERLAWALTGALAGGGAFWAIRAGYWLATRREGMGLGDVLLIAALGLALGPLALPLVVLLAALAALALALLRARRRGRSLGRLGRIPFGAALALAGAAVAVLG